MADIAELRRLHALEPNPLVKYRYAEDIAKAEAALHPPVLVSKLKKAEGDVLLSGGGMGKPNPGYGPRDRDDEPSGPGPEGSDDIEDELGGMVSQLDNFTDWLSGTDTEGFSPKEREMLKKVHASLLKAAEEAGHQVVGVDHTSEQGHGSNGENYASESNKAAGTEDVKKFALREFTAKDWETFSGSESPKDGKPLIGEVQVKLSKAANGSSAGVVLVDNVGAEILVMEGDAPQSWGIDKPFAEARAAVEKLAGNVDVALLKKAGWSKRIGA